MDDISDVCKWISEELHAIVAIEFHRADFPAMEGTHINIFVKYISEYELAKYFIINPDDEKKVRDFITQTEDFYSPVPLEVELYKDKLRAFSYISKNCRRKEFKFIPDKHSILEYIGYNLEPGMATIYLNGSSIKISEYKDMTWKFLEEIGCSKDDYLIAKAYVYTLLFMKFNYDKEAYERKVADVPENIKLEIMLTLEDLND